MEKNAFSDENTERYKNQVEEVRRCAPFDDTSKEDVFTSSNKKVANFMQILHSGQRMKKQSRSLSFILYSMRFNFLEIGVIKNGLVFKQLILNLDFDTLERQCSLVNQILLNFFQFSFNFMKSGNCSDI